MNSSLFLLLGIWVFSLLLGVEGIQKGVGWGHVSYSHTSLLLCSKTESYCRSVPFTDTTFVLGMLTLHHDKWNLEDVNIHLGEAGYVSMRMSTIFGP